MGSLSDVLENETNAIKMVQDSTDKTESTIESGPVIPKDNKNDLNGTQDSQDGTDSGVEVVQAPSSNGSNSDRVTPAQSCGSSLLSCYSEPEVDRGSDCGSESSNRSNLGKTNKTRGCRRTSDQNSRRTSESCSETSSTYKAHSSHSADFNKTVTSKLYDYKKSDSERKTSIGRRADSSTRNQSRERFATTVKNSNTGTGVKRSVSIKSERKTKIKPDTDDGRWPSSAQKTRSRGQSVADSNRSRNNSSNTMSSSTISANSMSSSFGSASNPKAESKSTALEKYGTLPRRPKKKSENPMDVSIIYSVVPRSSSVSREPSSNRAATLRRQQSKEKESGISNQKTLPPYPRAKKATGKIVIYHEVSVQTAVTSEDVANALAGIPIPPVPIVEKENKLIQTEGKDRMKKIEETYLRQCDELEKEKKDNERLRSERKNMNSRIWKMLGYSQVKNEENGLSELEQHLQAVGLTVIKQQEELNELRHFKNVAQRDLEKSFAAQKNLLQQQQEVEAEYAELQEFLQAEKTALSESLHDNEVEIDRLRLEVAEKSSLLDQQQAECKHLVRICEQRRQEILSLEAKLAGLEQRSRDVLLQQGAAVSGAAVALSGLGARLDGLVEQLAASYNVSEKDLEDVIFHNEAYSHSQSEDNSPDYPTPPKPGIGDLNASPKRGASFLNAILGAIRNATQSPFASGKKSPSSCTQADQSSDSLGLLDSEMEHNLALETVAEEDPLFLPDYIEVNKEDSITLTPFHESKSTPNKLCHSDSLQNLSAAILARQQVEKIERNKSPESAIPIEVNSLVDQVIDVDNLVTKLLKVLRIVQMENDACVDQLQDQKLDLAEKLQQEQIYRLRTEDNLKRLQHELKEARGQLTARIAQLEEAKSLLTENWRNSSAESQRQYATIDNALETLSSIQDVVNQFPPLAKLQQELEECNFHTASGDDLNANSANNGNIDNAVIKDVKKHNGTVLQTAI